MENIHLDYKRRTRKTQAELSKKPHHDEAPIELIGIPGVQFTEYLQQQHIRAIMCAHQVCV